MRHNKNQSVRKMKKLSVLLVALAILFTSCSDNEGVSKAFTKYRFKKGVVAITIPGFAIRLATLVADLDEEEEELLKHIDKVKVLVIEDNHLNGQINLHEEFAALIAEKDYEELLRIHDEGDDVTIMGKVGSNNTIKEMVVLVGGDDNALVYIKGKIKPELLNNYIQESDHKDFLSLGNIGF